MTDDLLELARFIINLRKHPLKYNAREHYPAALQRFQRAVEACDDPALLRAVVREDSGHVLPPPIKQVIYEKLLAVPSQRKPDVLRAYAMHLVMFGYTDESGTLLHDTDDKVNNLFAEAEHKETQS